MRILFRHLDPLKSGSVSSLVKMIEAYCERFPQDHITVMCVATSPLAQLGRIDNCSVEIVGRYLPREAYLLGAGDFAVWRLNRKHHFDVFWAINVGLYFSRSVSQVLTVNNSFQVYGTSAEYLHPHSGLRFRFLGQLFRRSLRLSSAAIVQTFLMKMYLEKIPGCPKQVAVIPKAVVANRDTSREASSEITRRLEGMDGVVKLLYVATDFPHKNHKVLVEMMGQFRQKGSAVKLLLTLTADEVQRIGGTLAGSLLESGDVVPLGWVDKDELNFLYGACDACVMPSLIESLSSAHIEAMYWKKPQVVADLPYAHDLCGDSALYADPNDPTAWRSQAEKLIANSELRKNLLARGAERFAAFPQTWVAMAEEVRKVLADVSQVDGG